MIKNQIAKLLAGVLVVSLVACGKEGDDAAATQEGDLSTLNQKISYIFGMNIANNFSQQEIQLDVDALSLALQDVYSETPSRLTEEEIQVAMETFQQQQQEKMAEMQAKQEAERAAAADTNLKAGQEFLAANKEKEGVMTLESGLQYKEVTPGTGKQPTASDTVTVHYRGTLIDGTEFDSSYARNEPATFPLQNVIPGWTEGLQLMSEGGKYELYLPPELAYGANGSGPVIGPNATLVFEVELIKVGNDEEAAAEPEEAK